MRRRVTKTKPKKRAYFSYNFFFSKLPSKYKFLFNFKIQIEFLFMHKNQMFLLLHLKLSQFLLFKTRFKPIFI